MKRMLVWLVLIAMLFTVGPAASAYASYTYSKDDVMTAVSGMGRMPSTYYNLAGMGLDAISSVSEAQAETFTKKLYQVWAFLSKYAYQYNGNKAIQDVLTPEQWSAVTSYASDLAYTYGKPANHQALYLALLQFLGSTKTTSLVKPGVPRSLLGVKFDEATAGETAYVKVYTTADVTGNVYLADANGNQISSHTEVIPYAGTLATFKEYILTVTYPSAGKNTVQLFGVDSKYADNYFTTSVKVNGKSASGSTGTNKDAVVSKVTAATATLGTASAIKVTTSVKTTAVKVTDKSGKLLAYSEEVIPGSVTATAKTFLVNYSFPSAGKQLIRAYAGTLGATMLWNSSYKSATLSVTAAAANATISKVSANTVMRGQNATVNVVASSSVTRVQLFDAKGEIAGFTKAFTVSGKTRVFKLPYSSNVEGSYKLTVQAGDDIAWNTGKKTVTAKFLAPSVTKVNSTKVKAGTLSTISVSASETAVKVELYDSGKNLIDTQTTLTGGKYVFTWTNSKGVKTIYLKVYDNIGGSGYYRSSVTFT
mgnify:FL=1